MVGAQHPPLWLKTEQQPQVSDQLCPFLAPGPDKIRPWTRFGLSTELDDPFSTWLRADPEMGVGKLSLNGCLYPGVLSKIQFGKKKKSFIDLRKQKKKTPALSDEFVDDVHPEMLLLGPAVLHPTLRTFSCISWLLGVPLLHSGYVS